jgi:acetyl-CoA carboxylase carboxyl transferase subunit alpha
MKHIHIEKHKNIYSPNDIKAPTKVGKTTKKYLTENSYDIVKIARHPNRPNSLELINYITSDFIQLHGDRGCGDDPAIVGGIGKIEEHSVVIIGQQKGRTTAEKIKRNFGMPQPEGYRKSLRIMRLAERFNLPLITLIDTPGAYPGIEAEERNQSEAIGKNIMVMSELKIPSIAIIIGEGGSGGALALGVSSRVHMFENSVYSVISPEGCASILLRDSSKASLISESLKLTATSAKYLGIIDSILKEPPGGNNNDHHKAADILKKTIDKDIKDLKLLSPKELQENRLKKYRNIGKHLV